MGRELKRVPPDFSWPLDKTWHGFLNPHYKAVKCTACDGTGASPRARYFSNQWYGKVPFHPAQTGSEPFSPKHPAIVQLAQRNIGHDESFYARLHRATSKDDAIYQEACRLCDHFNSQWSHHLGQVDVDALVDGERLWDFTHRPRTQEEADKLKADAAVDGGNDHWMREPNGYRPTAKEVNEWSLCGFGHDCINQSICVGARCKREGVEHYCAKCEGHGEIWPSKEAEVLHDSWEKVEPPTGGAYQIWETVSEGSPVSPPFLRPEDLARWMVANDDSVTKGTDYDGWMKFILGDGWAPSMVMVGGKVMSGVEAVTQEQ